MLRYLKQLKMRQKVLWSVLLIIVGLVVPFLCNASFDRIYNFYTDPLNENRITIKWTYNPDTETSVNAEFYWGHFGFDYFEDSSTDIWNFRDIVSECIANSQNIFCYSTFKELWHRSGGWWRLIVENPTGLIYSDVSEHLNPEFCINRQTARFSWVAGGVFGGTMEFWVYAPPNFLTSNKFCWGQQEIISEQRSVWGIVPVSGTEIIDLNAIITIGYEGLDDDYYDSLYVALRHPQTGLFTKAKQYDVSVIGQSGELEINLLDFNIEKNANWYLHAVATYEGYQYEDEFLTGYGWNWTSDLTDGNYYLDVNVEGFEEIFAMSDFNSWYAENSKFDEPTAMFSAIVGTFSPIFSVIGEFGNRIKNYFDVDSAYSKGHEIGKAIPIFSYYTGQISHFLGGFPIISWLLIVILILVGIFIFRIILKFIPFLGGS